MKPFSLLFHGLWISLALVPQFLAAQNWQNICSPGVSFYNKANHQVEVYRTDSIDGSQSQDTTYFSFRTIRESAYGGCFDTTYGSLFGLSILKQPGGIFVFTNPAGEPITLHTTEPAGYSWNLFDLGGGMYLEATVTECKPDTILEIPDSSKTITLVAKDGSGNVISHVMNGKTLILTKSLGLSQTLSWYDFPDAAVTFTLIGKQHPQAGIQNLTWNAIYDFEVGDRFDYTGSQSVGGVSVSISTIKTILARTYNADSTTLVYPMEICEKKSVSCPPPNVFYKLDTVTFTYTLSTAAINFMPQEFIPYEFQAPLYSRKYPDYINRMSHTSSDGAYFYDDPPCWSYTPEWYYEHTYAQGLGLTSYHEQEQFNYDESQLVYYQKGSETWGTPVAPDCQTLVGTPEVQGPTPAPSFLYPNPASGSFSFSPDATLPDTPATFRLLDFFGRTVFVTTLRHPGEKITPLEHLKGLFLWQVTSQQHSYSGKIVLK